MGSSLGASATMQSVKSIKDSAVIISKQPMSSVDANAGLFSLDLMAVKPAPGFYSLTVEASSASSKALVGQKSSELVVKVTAEVELVDVKISVGEQDHKANMMSLVKGVHV